LSGKERHETLVVDDEESKGEFLDIMLTKEGYLPTLAESRESACLILEKEYFDLVIMDIHMNDIDGIGVLKKANKIK